jgi:hypothetical protein
MTLRFITRVQGNTERATIVEAKRRVEWAWLPFSFESTRPKRKRDAVVTVRPIMPYLFGMATKAQLMRLMDYRSVFGPTWFVPDREWGGLMAYVEDVEREFANNVQAYLDDERAFHCQFKAGQSVRLRQRGLELFPATFLAITDEGLYRCETDMMGRKVAVDAKPQHVVA